MNTLIIIGNGFDLAHGLKTSYNHFFEYTVEQILNKKIEYTNLVKITTPINSVESFLDHHKYHNYKNNFFKLLTEDFIEKNWCDIEALYFNHLKQVASIPNKYFDDIQDLNNQFSTIKKLLEEYLLTLDYPKLNHGYFNQLFDKYLLNKPLLLNFNYTKICSQYTNDRIRILDIHGQLGNSENPIIFGYAATESQIKDLRKKDNEFMKNIKRTNYRVTSNYRFLRNYLDTTQNGIKVVIMGHSCGESDQLILREIFNHENTHSIEIVYYNFDGYMEQTINITKLFNQEDDQNKIVEFSRLIKMPQVNENSDYEKLLNKYNPMTN